MGQSANLPIQPAPLPAGASFANTTQPATPLSTGPAMTAPASSAPQNVFEGASQAMQQAGQTFGQFTQGQMNPYTQNVIDRTQQDIMRQQQLAEQNLGAQATAANAFGGSRHGVAQGVMAGEYGRMAGDIAAQQRMQAFDKSQDLALRGAAGLGTVGQQAFGMGQATQAAVGQQGEFMRALQQQIIDAAKGQYAGAAGTPLAGLGALSSVLSASRFPTTTATTGTATQPYDPSALFATLAYNTVLGGSPIGT